MKNFRDTIDYDGMGNQGRIGTRQIYKKKNNTDIIVKYLAFGTVVLLCSVVLSMMLIDVS
tara:strand:+ start:310 stop:489 length:180 start_codon:yes stop_codon:yes gene_type:complete